ncbi:pentapeptide repeat-containing protein [Thioclava nitratireducens]|uniref:pentapeptide repeat-containing protein n=1 Tax=Thioclava nitratireducens TaxID=1915078 RepID=UPI00247FD4B7|nr:pentapeptide repeat-containing protein [Thioclava nitratireducens]WGT48901.1 pentapeptide repeat-containing protein [Thioclava nitratireducens]
MLNSAPLSDLLHASDLPKMFEKAIGSAYRFADLVTTLDLDKSSDFISSNLREVDFSYADLRNFNFTGADLTGSYGVQILIDDTTILKNADVRDSCFATYKRERDLFTKNNRARLAYDALKFGDTYEVSSWVHTRLSDESFKNPLLKDISRDAAIILCQKLLTDEIDLTKRTDLFLNLDNIVRSNSEVRELLLGIMARQIENLPVMRKFIKIAARRYSQDPLIGRALNLLSKAENKNLRETLFTNISGTRFFYQNFPTLRSEFLREENLLIRQQILKSAALSLSRSHLSAINMDASLSDVFTSDILDVGDLLDEDIATEIASKISLRDLENARRYDDIRHWREAPAPKTISRDVNTVIRLQEEVMAKADIVRHVFAYEHPTEAEAALERLRSRSRRTWYEKS